MEWWDRRSSGLSAVSPTDRDGRGHSPTDLAYEACTGTTGSGSSPPHILHFRSRALPRGPFLSISLSPSPKDFERFIFLWAAQVSLTGHEEVEITRWRTTGWRFFFADKSDYFHEFHANYRVQSRLSRGFVVVLHSRRLHVVFEGGRGKGWSLYGLIQLVFTMICCISRFISIGDFSKKKDIYFDYLDTFYFRLLCFFYQIKVSVYCNDKGRIFIYRYEIGVNGKSGLLKSVQI